MALHMIATKKIYVWQWKEDLTLFAIYRYVLIVLLGQKGAQMQENLLSL